MIRLLLIWCFVGLVLGEYDAHRQAGDSVGQAIGNTVLAAVVPPWTAIKLLVAKIKAKAAEKKAQ